MKFSKTTREHKSLLIHSAWQQGLRTASEIAEFAQVSPAYARKVILDSGLRPKRGRRGPKAGPRLLTPDQLTVLFEATQARDIIGVRVAAREMFGVELLDTTTRRYIERSQMKSPPRKAGVPRLVSDEQIDAIVQKFRDAGVEEPSPISVSDQLFRILGRRVSKASVYNYLNIIKARLK